MKIKIFGIIVGVLIVVAAAFFIYAKNYQLKQTNNENPLFWEKSVRNIKEKYADIDSVDIVLTGSSSPRKWASFAQDFSPFTIVNTGFGGSKVADSTYWYNEIAGRFQPKVLIFWSGTNDIHGLNETSKSGDETTSLFLEFYTKAQETNPGIKIVFIPINPTKARAQIWDEANTYNQNVKTLASVDDNLYYVDVTDILMENETYDQKYLASDGLHLNDDGYAVILKATYPLVQKALSRFEQ